MEPQAVLSEGVHLYQRSPSLTGPLRSAPSCAWEVISPESSNTSISPLIFSLTVKWDLNDEGQHYKLNILENASTAFVFIIVVVNVFITAFGVQRPSLKSWSQACFCVYWTVQWRRTSGLVFTATYPHHRKGMQANPPFCHLSLTDSVHVCVCVCGGVVLTVNNCVVCYFFQYCLLLMTIDLFTFIFKVNISENAVAV